MTATTLESTQPMAKPSRLRARSAQSTIPPVESDPGLFVNQSSLYGRVPTRRGSGRSLWLLAPVAAVAIGGVVYLTTFQGHSPTSQQTQTTTTTSERVATPAVNPLATITAPVTTPAAPVRTTTTTTTRVAVQQRHTVVRRPATRVPAPAEQSPAIGTGVTANVSAPVAPTSPAPTVAVNPPPVAIPAPTPDAAATAQAAPVVPAQPVTPPLGAVATTAPPTDPAQQ